MHRLRSKLQTSLMAALMLAVILSPVAIALDKTKGNVLQNNINHKVRRVILITVDTLRQDILSAYGQGDVKSESIDRLASDGIIFQNAYSCAPWTLPAMACIFTGQDAKVHGVEGSLTRLPDGLPTLAEQMLANGYFTAAVGRNGFLTSRGMNRGFIEYNLYPKSSLGSSLGGFILQQLFPDKFRLKASTSTLTRVALDWLESNHDKDFFLWIHYLDPHGPYTPPLDYVLQRSDLPVIATAKNELKKKDHFLSDPKILEQDPFPSTTKKQLIKELYNGEVRLIDRNIENLVAALKKLKIYDETLLILTSDHGEEFWEHGGFEHGRTLYNESLKVPLIIKIPNSAGGKRVTHPVSTTDLLPTILDLCSIPASSSLSNGNSLALLWESPREPDLPLYPVSSNSLHYDAQRSIVFKQHKYIRFLSSGGEELFDLVNDPKELNSVAKDSQLLLQEARQILKRIDEEAIRKRRIHRLTNIPEKTDVESIKELKALGYIQ